MNWRHLLVAIAATQQLGAACQSRLRGAGAPKPRPGHTAVQLDWVTDEFPASIKVYELDEQSNLKPWTTGTVKDRAYLPLGPELPDGLIYMRPGAVRRLVLVVENKTPEKLYFFAAPHAVEPAKLALGFEFRCLCLNHAYRVDSGRTWYRVVEAKLDKDYQAKAMKATHALIAIDKRRAGGMEIPGAVMEPPERRPTVTFENVTDELTAEALLGIKHDLHKCYAEHTKRHPEDLRPRAFDMTYKAGRRGKPGNVKVAPTDANAAALGQCVRAKISTLGMSGTKPKKTASIRVIFGS